MDSRLVSFEDCVREVVGLDAVMRFDTVANFWLHEYEFASYVLAGCGRCFMSRNGIRLPLGAGSLARGLQFEFGEAIRLAELHGA